MMPTPDAGPPGRRRRLLPWVIGALIVLLLSAGVAAVAVRGGGTEAETGAPSGPGGSAPAATPGESTTSTTTGPPVPAALKKVFDELQAQTAELRQLRWQGPLDLRVVPRPELARLVREVVQRDTDPSQVAGEEATLKLLKLIPPDLDYGQLLLDLLAEQVLGFYDPLTRRLVVGNDGDDTELDGITKWVIVHEMTHALTDQVFNFGPPTDALYKADKADEAAAYSALLEGDAVLVQNQWAERYLSPEEQLIIALGGGGADVDVLGKAPSYVQQDLIFPYDSGKKFVDALYASGGFAAVDAAYRRPPTSTEQILNPQAYRTGQDAAPPALPDIAAIAGCTRLRTGTLGQFDMRATLDTHLTGAEASRAVEGWNGDAYGVVRCGSSLGMAQRWETDPGTDPARFVEGVSRWAAQWSGSGRGPGADGRFSGPRGTGRVVRTGSRAELVLAQDAATADRLVSALAG